MYSLTKFYPDCVIALDETVKSTLFLKCIAEKSTYFVNFHSLTQHFQDPIPAPKDFFF